MGALSAHFGRERFEQTLEFEGLGLATIEDCLNDVGSQKRHPKHAADIGFVDAVPMRKLGGRCI